MYRPYTPHQSPNAQRNGYQYSQTFQPASQQQPSAMLQQNLPPHNAGSQFNTLNNYNTRISGTNFRHDAHLSSHQPQQQTHFYNKTATNWGIPEIGASGNNSL